MNKLVRSILPLCLCLMAGCDGDDLVGWVDLSVQQRVRISREQPPEGQVGKAYSFCITARVENDPNDSDYDYHFELVDGAIPPGTELSPCWRIDTKFAKIAGVPTQAGQFTFAVSVKADITPDWFDDDRDEAIYTITIR